MQLVQNGPDIPDELLQAHEEGRVVFFCGAGISYPAGLPGFRGLVDDIYKSVGTVRSKIEQDVYDREQYDATLDLLERRVPGGREAVRRALANALQPKLRRKGATDTHQALLELANGRDGSIRLVTTNFDRVFEYLIKRDKLNVQAYPAPPYRFPKRVGGMELFTCTDPYKSPLDASSLNRLVITSGDFGLAYLTERWAARFVSDLFKNYTVCFVGYRINDPVLRYMMDALAADRMLGESTPPAYALADAQPGEEDQKLTEWQAKGVTPILYQTARGGKDHSTLHRTLKTWADVYRDGTQGKERIVVDNAIALPSASTRQDDFVGRLLWALSDNSGLPARRFAELDPAPPPLDWLTPLSEARYGHYDLPRFGIRPTAEPDLKLTYSLVQRPAPYSHAPRMALLADSSGASRWDRVMFHLAQWLTRHLNDSTLILWLAQRSTPLHPDLRWAIEREMEKFERLGREGNSAELDRIRANAPNAIPSPRMKMLWRLLLLNRAKSAGDDLRLYDWKNRLERDGLTATLRMELRELLSPKVALRKAFQWSDSEGPEEPSVRDDENSVECSLVLSTDHARSAIEDIATSPLWTDALPNLVDEFELLLKDSLELLREIGLADDHHDPAFWHLPSISPHRQNNGFEDWVILIELLRDAWAAVHASDQDYARRIVDRWLAQRYPTFRRLALYAATHDGIAPQGEWVDWLLTDNAWWLWSDESKREAMRLLVLRSASLPRAARTRLEAAILAGPPREMFKDELPPEEWKRISDRYSWLRLLKLQATDGPAHLRMKSLASEYPDWSLTDDERDEFSFWMSGTGDPDFESSKEVDTAPTSRRALVVWLQKTTGSRFYYEDNWRDSCRQNFPASLTALCELSLKALWPTSRWEEALQSWAESEDHLRRSWRWAAPILLQMPNDILLKISHAASWWLRAVSKTLDPLDPNFLPLCTRMLSLQHEEFASPTDSLTQAINHPVGRTTEAVLNFWFQRQPNDNQGLPRDLSTVLTHLSESTAPQHRHGRVLLASRLIALFRVDRDWTRDHLLPLFDWRSTPQEARAVWSGFLWSPRLYRPLLTELREAFLGTAKYYLELSEPRSNYAALLTFAALDPNPAFTTEEIRSAISSLPEEGLHNSAQALIRALTGAGDQREQYWANRIKPFWNEIWPKSRDLVSDSLASDLARLAIESGRAFPDALVTILSWLRPIERPFGVVRLLEQSGRCTQFPESALTLLDTLVANQPWPSKDLAACLRAIAKAAPKLEKDRRYKRLTEYVRLHRG